MGNIEFYTEGNLTISFGTGTKIEDACQKALELMRTIKNKILVEFNGTIFPIEFDSDLDLNSAIENYYNCRNKSKSDFDLEDSAIEWTNAKIEPYENIPLIIYAPNWNDGAITYGYRTSIGDSKIWVIEGSFTEEGLTQEQRDNLFKVTHWSYFPLEVKRKEKEE